MFVGGEVDRWVAARARTGAIAMNRTMAAVSNGAADCEWGLGIMVRAIPEGFGRIGKFTDGCGRRKSCSGSRMWQRTPIKRFTPRKARDGEALAFTGVAAIAKMAVRCENGCGVKD